MLGQHFCVADDDEEVVVDVERISVDDAELQTVGKKPELVVVAGVVMMYSQAADVPQVPVVSLVAIVDNLQLLIN